MSKPKFKINLSNVIDSSEKKYDTRIENRKKLSAYFDYVQSLDRKLKHSLASYSHSSHINNTLRADNTTSGTFSESSQELEHIRNIKESFAKGPNVTIPLTLYRGNTFRKSESYEDKGFLSTSYDKDAAMEFTSGKCCLYIITVTPGQYTVLPIEGLSSSPDEHEVLLPPGKISIQLIEESGTKENPDTVDKIYCTYIPNDAYIIPTDKM